MTSPELICRAEKLENALSNGNFVDYCLYKNCRTFRQRKYIEGLEIVALHLENDRQKQRQKLLQLLDFESAK